MKNIKIKVVQILALSLVAVGSAWSYTINGGIFDGTDVGSADTFIAEDEKKGNPTNELAWVNTLLDPDVTYDGIKTEDVIYFATNEDSSVFAFQLVSDPGYYIIKNATRIALFENLNDSAWGVFDADSLTGGMNIPSSEMEISHVTEFVSQPNQVSEPASIALLGLGLLGLAFTRKKQSA